MPPLDFIRAFRQYGKEKIGETMKQEQKLSEQASANMNARRAELALARGQLDRSRGYSEATKVLSNLEAALSEHSSALEKMKTKTSRISEHASRYIDRQGMCLPGDITAITNEIIRGADLVSVITKARLPLDQSLYRNLKLPEPSDLELVKDLDFERAAVMALREAIRLQKTIVAATRRQSIVEFARSLDGGRAILARKLLAAIRELDDLVGEDRGLAQQLEPTEVQFLHPAPFPMNIASQELRDWLFECVEQGLLQATELNGIRLP